MVKELSTQFFEIFKNTKHNLKSNLFPFSQMVQLVCDGLADLLNCPIVWFGVKSPDGTIKCYAQAGKAVNFFEPKSMRWDDTGLGQNCAGMAIRSRMIQFLDITSIDDSLPWAMKIKNLDINGALAIPLQSSQEEIVGVIVIYSKDIDRYSKESIETLGSFALQVSLLLEIENTRVRLSRYSYLSEYSRDIFLFVRPDGKITEANRAAEQAYGYSKQELESMSIFDLRMDQSNFITDQMKQAMMKGIIFETVHKRKDGNLFPVEVSSRGGLFDEGPILLSVIRDISDRKKVEEALWNAKEKAQVTLNSIGDGVITTDIYQNIESINPVAEELTGWTTEEAKGRPLFTVFNIINEKTGFAPENPVKKCLETGRIVGLANHSILISKSGKQIPIEDSASPIKDLKGEIIGAILVFYDVSERRKLLNELNYQATHDSLTGLPNRSSFHNYLEKILEDSKDEKKVFVVLFMDVDRFKFINDSFGHDIGDLMLVDLAKRVEAHLDKRDIFCRYGGDEFAMIMTDVQQLDNVFDKVRRIIKSCSEKFLINQYEIFTNLSVGISIHPNNGDNIKSLLKNADMAMYSAKKEGGNRYHVYMKGESRKILNNFNLTGMLKRALEKSEFRLYYQPQVDITSNKVWGVEALIRWFSPTGLITPADFIPSAEETDMIIPIGEWVINESCKQFKIWQDKGLPPVVMSVNISAKQFCQPNFMDMVCSILDKYDINPCWINLEITESTAIKNFDYTSKTISRLNQIGIKIALDDFGTGYSSLSHLANLQLSSLKIDKSLFHNFVNDRKKINIVKAIINLAKILGIEVIAEGIEHEEEIKLLKKFKCSKVQGYLISKPLSVFELEQFLFKF